MDSGRRKVFWALCFLLLLLEASSAKNIWKRALHARLAEKPHVSAGVGRLGGDGQSPHTVCSASTPPSADRVSVFLYLCVSKAGGRRMKLTPSEGSFLGSKEAKNPSKVCEER